MFISKKFICHSPGEPIVQLRFNVKISINHLQKLRDRF